MSKILQVLIALLAAAPSVAVADILLEMDGIKGEVIDDIHPAALQVESWSWGASNPATLGIKGVTATKANLGEVNVFLNANFTLPALLTACAKGQHLRTAKLYVRRPGDDSKLDYLTITLSDVLVTSVSISTAAASSSGAQSMSLTFTKIEMAYKRPDGASPPAFTYDQLNPPPTP